MSHFGLKINKSERPDTNPYTLYYPHTTHISNRIWDQDHYQLISIDPAKKNYAFRIEKRYHSGKITTIAFDKTQIEEIIDDGKITICNTYKVLSNFLDKFEMFYKHCHFIIIERQLPQNYKATRIAQHTLSYFMLKLTNSPLLPSFIEINPKLKGKILGAPKNINDKQLKYWAIEKGTAILHARNDTFALQILNKFKNKQDDLCDTICQAEAFIIYSNLNKAQSQAQPQAQPQAQAQAQAQE